MLWQRGSACRACLAKDCTCLLSPFWGRLCLQNRFMAAFPTCSGSPPLLADSAVHLVLTLMGSSSCWLLSVFLLLWFITVKVEFTASVMLNQGSQVEGAGAGTDTRTPPPGHNCPGCSEGSLPCTAQSTRARLPPVWGSLTSPSCGGVMLELSRLLTNRASSCTR